MTKTELTKKVAEKCEITVAEAGKAVDALIGTIEETLKEGGDLTLVGFGRFYVKETAERQGINPATKEKITIPAKRSGAFKAGAALKNL